MSATRHRRIDLVGGLRAVAAVQHTWQIEHGFDGQQARAASASLDRLEGHAGGGQAPCGGFCGVAGLEYWRAGLTVHHRDLIDDPALWRSSRR